MSKIMLFLAMILCVIPGLTYASPLMDYAAGKTAVDITSYPNLHIKDHYADQVGIADIGTMNSRNNNMDWDITTGIGGNWALQYRQFNPEGEKTSIINSTITYGMKTQEVNALYKLNSNLSAFVGWHQAKFSYEFLNFPFSAENKDVLQGGIIGTTKIAPKTYLYGIIGVGKDLQNIETGISYEVAKHVELNLVYRYKKVEDMNDVIDGTPYKDSVTAHGYGLGVTYKF